MVVQNYSTFCCHSSEFKFLPRCCFNGPARTLQPGEIFAGWLPLVGGSAMQHVGLFKSRVHREELHKTTRLGVF